MCHTINYNGILIEEKAYLEAGGNPEYISHGICDNPDCRNAYVLFASGGDEELADIIKEELTKENDK